MLLNFSYLHIKERVNFKSLLYYSFYYIISVLLLVSGSSKIIDPENFIKVLNVTLSFLGENTIVLIATVLPVFEIALGLMLLLKIKVKETLITTLILFIGFVLFAGYGFIAGFDVDCGCFGSNVTSEFGIWMIIRNIFFLILSIVVLISNNRIIKND